MRRQIRAVLPWLMAVVMSPALAAPNFLGQSGNLVTPDDLIIPTREFSLGYHYIDKKVFGSGDSMHIVSANFGFTPQFEAGLAYVDRGRSELVVNGKYQILRERPGSPSFTVGVVDLFDSLDQDPSFFFLVGKNLTAASRDVRTETEGRTVRGYLGFGTGSYDGLIAGLSFIATPQLALMAEYAPEGPLTGRDDSFNVGLRYAVSNRIRLDAGLFDFDNLGVGISFNSAFGR